MLFCGPLLTKIYTWHNMIYWLFSNSIKAIISREQGPPNGHYAYCLMAFSHSLYSINNAKKGARRIARRLMKLGYKCRFSNYRILNVMARCRLPFRVKLEDLARTRPRQMSYEPELTPGLTYKNPNIPSLSLTLFSTGRLVIMGEFY